MCPHLFWHSYLFKDKLGEDPLFEADIIIENGKIIDVGENLTRTPNDHVIDAQGRHITPGIITFSQLIRRVSF